MGDTNKESLGEVEETEPSKEKTNEVSVVKCDDEKIVADENEVDKPKEVSSFIKQKDVPEEVKSTNENKAPDNVGEDNLHYEDGFCVYTEPESKCQFIWYEEKQEWVPREKSGAFTDRNDEYEPYTYRDSETGIKYVWDVDKNEWKDIGDKVENTHMKGPKLESTEEHYEKDEEEEDKNEDVQPKPKEIKKQDMSKGHYSYENDTHIYTDPSDGSKYFWDKEKNAWIPKVDDDFLAKYQMSYGFVDPNENETKLEEKKESPPPPSSTDPPENLKRKAPQEPAWFDVGEESTKVYVSGLPLDITETEFVDIMQKCGLVMRDIDSNKMKIKIYLDRETSLPKGDALCTYIKKESVDLALNLLDGYDLRGHRISVEKAKFTMKGTAYDPSLKPKKRRKKDVEKLKKMQEKLFDWRPDKFRGERSKHEKIIVVKNLFDPADFVKDVKLILDYQQDLREECLKCGAVKKVIIYDAHPEGVAQINFKEVEAADACIQLLNGRWFGQRKITAETWDGKTKYKMTETDEQIKARLAKWEKFLETGEALKEKEQDKDIKVKDDSEVSVPETENIFSLEDAVNSKTTPDNEKESEKVEKECEEMGQDSDGGTRSSVGSDYDTDDESKTTSN